MASKIIVRNPAILSGEPVFRGTRVPFKALTDYLEHERSLSEFLEDFPSVTSNEAIAALEEARISLTAVGRSTLTDSSRTRGNLSEAIRRRFAPFGGIELSLPRRDAIRSAPGRRQKAGELLPG